MFRMFRVRTIRTGDLGLLLEGERGLGGLNVPPPRLVGLRLPEEDLLDVLDGWAAGASDRPR